MCEWCGRGEHFCAPMHAVDQNHTKWLDLQTYDPWVIRCQSKISWQETSNLSRSASSDTLRKSMSYLSKKYCMAFRPSMSTCCRSLPASNERKITGKVSFHCWVNSWHIPRFISRLTAQEFVAMLQVRKVLRKDTKKRQHSKPMCRCSARKSWTSIGP